VVHHCVTCTDIFLSNKLCRMNLGIIAYLIIIKHWIKQSINLIRICCNCIPPLCCDSRCVRLIRSWYPWISLRTHLMYLPSGSLPRKLPLTLPDRVTPMGPTSSGVHVRELPLADVTVGDFLKIFLFLFFYSGYWKVTYTSWVIQVHNKYINEGEAVAGLFAFNGALVL
jgi:hypothetical protein